MVIVSAPQKPTQKNEEQKKSNGKKGKNIEGKERNR